VAVHAVAAELHGPEGQLHPSQLCQGHLWQKGEGTKVSFKQLRKTKRFGSPRVDIELKNLNNGFLHIDPDTELAFDLTST
jgi:hypothetical protein